MDFFFWNLDTCSFDDGSIQEEVRVRCRSGAEGYLGTAYILARFLLDGALVVESCWHTLKQPHWTTDHIHVLYSTYKGSKSWMLHLSSLHRISLGPYLVIKHAKTTC